jgi:hypothetical protein
MVSRILKTAGAAAALALLVFAGGIQAPPSAQAVIPPPCPAAPGVPGAVTYRVVATLPLVAPPADGVCIVLPGAPPIGAGAVIQTPPTCPPPFAVGAGASLVWADWGAGAPCVFPLQTVVLEFKGPPGIPLGLMAGAAIWSPGGVGSAWVWPAACPAGPPAVGAVPLVAVAVAPAAPAAAYGGVCLTLPLGPISAPAVVLNPAGCPLPAIAPAPPIPNPVFGAFASAAATQIWVDWDVKCAAAGSAVTISFMGPAALIGPCVGCVTWLGSSAIGNATIVAAGPAVGGVSAAPDAASLPAASTTGSSTDRAGWYIGGGGAALVLIVGAGAWYVRRRQLA